MIVTDNIGSIVEFLATNAMSNSAALVGRWLSNNKRKLVEDYRRWQADEGFVDKQRPKLTFVISDDWQAVYVNGVILAEGHKLDAQELAEILDIETESVEANSLWATEQSMPVKLQDVVTSDQEWVLDESDKEVVEDEPEEEEDEYDADDFGGQETDFDSESSDEDREYS
jgi:hypothetical protein